MHIIPDETPQLIIHVITLVFLIGIAESIEEWIDGIYERIRKKPLPEAIGYLLVFAIGYFFAYNGNWKFMAFLGYEGIYWWSPWVDLGLTAALISAGSNSMEKKFALISRIPSPFYGIKSMVPKKKQSTREQIVPTQTINTTAGKTETQNPAPINPDNRQTKYSSNDPMI